MPEARAVISLLLPNAELLRRSKDLHETFALKTFRDEVFARNRTIAERFVDEARSWIKLDLHENIVEARGAEFFEGKPYLFLEYISGGDLGNLIGTPRLTDEQGQRL